MKLTIALIFILASNSVFAKPDTNYSVGYSSEFEFFNNLVCEEALLSALGKGFKINESRIDETNKLQIATKQYLTLSMDILSLVKVGRNEDAREKANQLQLYCRMNGFHCGELQNISLNFESLISEVENQISYVELNNKVISDFVNRQKEICLEAHLEDELEMYNLMYPKEDAFLKPSREEVSQRLRSREQIEPNDFIDLTGERDFGYTCPVGGVTTVNIQKEQAAFLRQCRDRQLQQNSSIPSTLRNRATAVRQ